MIIFICFEFYQCFWEEDGVVKIEKSKIFIGCLNFPLFAVGWVKFCEKFQRFMKDGFRYVSTDFLWQKGFVGQSILSKS